MRTLIRFQPKGVMGDALFSLGAAQLLDWRLLVDTAMAVLGARLDLQTPVAVWETRFTGDRRVRVLLSLPGGKPRDVLGRSAPAARIRPK